MTSPLDRLREVLAGRYAVDRELGTGGMARVYLASDLKHNRSVAVKVLRPEFSGAGMRDRFVREIETVARLTHPHILPLHDSGTVGDLCYFVMPYVEGESLRERLDREGQLSIEEALRITREVADAIAYAHARGVIHRDIKPRNIMMESDHAVVADFGIALLLDKEMSGRLTSSGFSPGTPLYMSPEQACGDRHLDARSDIYSLGCVLYEMLAGDPPFTGSSVHSIVARKVTESPRGLRTARNTITETLEAVTLKSLARVPADRYRSAVEFGQALDEAARDQLRQSDSVRNSPRAAAGSQPARATSGNAVDASFHRTAGIARAAGITVAALAAVVVLLGAVGYLNTKAFDLKLQVPARYAPSRTDSVAVGAEAFIPFVIFGFVTVIAVLLLAVFGRVLVSIAGGAPRLGEWLRRAQHSTTTRWRRLRNAVAPVRIAELFLLAAILLTGAVHLLFWPIFVPLFTAETERWACAFRAEHRALSLILTVLTVGLAFSWVRLFGWLRTRVSARELAVPRWGSLAVIVALVLSQTLPWRLVWDMSYERVDVGAERGYILIETPSELVIYNADRRATVAYGVDGESISRRHIAGHIFEEPEVFYSSIPECLSVTNR